MNFLIEISRGQSGADRDAAAFGLSPVFAMPPLKIWADEQGISLGNGGWIGGHLFNRDNPTARLSVLSEELVSQIAASQGRELAENVWGGYVAAILAHPSRLSILRDPSGMVPVYILEEDSRILLSSDARLLRPGPSALDPLALGRYLTGIDSIARQTGLEGIVELLPGEALEWVDGQARISQWWLPWSACRSTADASVREVTDALRETIANCCSAWGSCYDRKLLGVSGGLDSSIVAATIGSSRLLTLIGPDPEGDETRYAKAVADALERNLERHFLQVEAVDVKRASHTHLPWPATSYLTQAISAIHQQCSNQGEFDAIFSGNGGDNVFCYMRSVNPLLDRVIADGFSKGAWETLHDLLDWTGATYFEAFRQLRRRYRQPNNIFMRSSNFTGLTKDLQGAVAASPDVHPWHRGPGGILPGKMVHVAMVSRAQRSFEIYPRDVGPAHIAPLLSQPVIEACLAIPTWQWIAGGQNRAVVRRAFKDHLPPEIIDRRSKGGPEGFMQAIYRTQHRVIREMLLDGFLVGNGIVDRGFVEQADDWAAEGRKRAQRLLSFAAVEAWAQDWKSRPAPGLIGVRAA